MKRRFVDNGAERPVRGRKPEEQHVFAEQPRNRRDPSAVAVHQVIVRELGAQTAQREVQEIGGDKGGSQQEQHPPRLGTHSRLNDRPSR
jgi:hypothetical protein